MPIYKVLVDEARWKAVFQTVNGCAAHSSRRLLTLHLKTCSLVTLFTISVVGGEEKANWLIMSNEQATLGLFQGMFERNILTFNPGWDSNAEEMSDFTDVRMLQKQLQEHGLKFDSEADTTTQGPASFMIKDPDGNPILVDQHI